jgi:outer membrane assembly lipoprotein YfiO
MMRLILRTLPFLLFLLTFWGCGQKGAKLQKSVVPPDKTLFETGQEYLEKSQFIKARLSFQTLINTYPDSELASESVLAIGDSFYDEGGTENLLQAEDQYKNFIVFFPTNPKAADAQMKIASLNMKMMRSPDRDQSYAYKAQDSLRKMIELFPDSEYIPIAKEQLKQVQETLAQSNFGVGKFYLDRGRHRAATSRFKENVEKYAEFSGMDENLFLLAQSLEKSENSDEASIYYSRIAKEFPFSPRFDLAKARLEEMGKPLPEIDTQLAALNESRQKPAEGFSPLRPIKDFGKALGFVGPPDPYETAKRAVESSRSEAGAAETATVAEGEKAGDDFPIQATITKSSTGQSDAKAVLGSNSKETDKNPDKNADKDNKKKPKKSSGGKPNEKKPS